MFRRSLIMSAAIACSMLLGGCATRMPAPQVALPPLRLAPAALERELALQQRLDVRHGAHAQSLEALLEVDAGAVRLAVQAMGRTGVRLRWDGTTLEQQRADWLPPMVRGERVLDDVQFALWPADAIRAALPPEWTLVDEGAHRRLLQAGVEWLRVERLDGERRMHLSNRAEGYELEITSVPLQDAMP